MSVFKGQIVKLATKTGNGKRGQWTAYSAKMKDENGREYDEWISFGFENPGVGEGDYVEVQTEKDGNYNKATKVTKIDKPRASNTGSAAAPAAATGVGRDASIQYQSSRKDALVFMQILAEADALPISGAKTAAGVAKRNEELHQILDKYTVQFYNDVASGRILETVEDAGSIEETEEGQLPEPGADDNDD